MKELKKLVLIFIFIISLSIMNNVYAESFTRQDITTSNLSNIAQLELDKKNLIANMNLMAGSGPTPIYTDEHGFYQSARWMDIDTGAGTNKNDHTGPSKPIVQFRKIGFGDISTAKPYFGQNMTNVYGIADHPIIMEANITTVDTGVGVAGILYAINNKPTMTSAEINEACKNSTYYSKYHVAYGIYFGGRYIIGFNDKNDIGKYLHLIAVDNNKNESPVLDIKIEQEKFDLYQDGSDIKVDRRERRKIVKDGKIVERDENTYNLFRSTDGNNFEPVSAETVIDGNYVKFKNIKKIDSASPKFVQFPSSINGDFKLKVIAEDEGTVNYYYATSVEYVDVGVVSNYPTNPKTLYTTGTACTGTAKYSTAITETSGIRGYIYNVTYNKTTPIKDGKIYTDLAQIENELKNMALNGTGKKYVNISAVDWAGNISTPISLSFPTAKPGTEATKVTIYRTGTNQPVSGVQIALYDKDKNLLKTFTTGADGKIDLAIDENLLYGGTYYYKEIRSSSRI